ncbi:PDZ domain-containing protein [bacterium]|nr:PDZ domain-containing protein [bacterium]
MINSKGELIGINTAIVSRSGGSQGIGFAIPLDLATSAMNSIIERGYVVRGYIGVYPQDITPEMANVFKIKGTSGALIAEVVKDSPADDAGIERGDVVLSFGEKMIKDSKDFRTVAAAAVPGTKVDIGIMRDKKMRNIEIKVGERPDSHGGEKPKNEDEFPIFLGVELNTLDNNYRRSFDIPGAVKGVVITDIDRTSPAFESGLRKGDIIVEVNRKEIKDISDFREALKGVKKNTVVAAIYRKGHYSYIEIES